MITIPINGKTCHAIIDSGAVLPCLEIAAELMESGLHTFVEHNPTRFGMANSTTEDGGGVLDLEMSSDGVETVRFPVHYIPRLGSLSLGGTHDYYEGRCRPVRQKVYRRSPAILVAMHEIVDQMLVNGVIEPCESSKWCSQPVMVKRPN